jgi:DNA ligase (NAD+)
MEAPPNMDPMTVTPAQRITELAGQITAHRDAYYRGAPTIADADYDSLEDELRGLLDAHPDLTPDPNPLEQVGAPAAAPRQPVRHARPMLSLEKATTAEQVQAFAGRFPGQQLAVMAKLDGLSLSLVYEDGELARAATRGDGRTGEDVTAAVRALVDHVPERISERSRVEVRGEAVMLRPTFAAYNAAHAEAPLVNPRNAAAGTLVAKDPATVADRRLAFYAFDVDLPTPAAALSDALTLAATWGFGRPALDLHDSVGVQESIDAIEAQRATLPYDIDGAVVRLNDTAAYQAAGVRSNSPRGAVAFKYPAEEKSTVLRDVVWQVGKIGKVAPVAELSPVFVGGTTVERATLANQAVMAAKDVRIGDTVIVRRAGDVIPEVVAVASPEQRTGEERVPEVPTTCPSCATALLVEGNSRELYCPNIMGCPAQTVRRLIHWASRAGRRHRRRRPDVDRTPRRRRQARCDRRLLRADLRGPHHLRRHGRHQRPADARLDRGLEWRRSAPRADRTVDPSRQ